MSHVVENKHSKLLLILGRLRNSLFQKKFLTEAGSSGILSSKETNGAFKHILEINELRAKSLKSGIEKRSM